MKKRQLLILVVDDELPELKLLSSGFILEGYDVIAAHNGPAAVEAYEGLSPDLVVLGVGLPGMDGLGVLAHIRRRADTPVVMITGRDDSRCERQARAAGADEYLTKPFDRKELLGFVRSAIGRGWLSRQRTSVES